MASIQKVKDGSTTKWITTVSLGFKPNGDRIRKKKTFYSESEAKRWGRDMEKEADEGSLVDIANIKFSKWASEWLEINKVLLSPSTFRSYKIYVNSHFIAYFGNLKVSKINDILIKKYISEKLQTLSPTTVRKHFYVLSRILEDVMKQKNPCRNISPPAPNNFKPHIITDDEFKQIWDFFKGKPHELTILLGGLCGMRRGEIYALKWDDINDKDHTIRIDTAVCKNDEDEFVERNTTKSANGVRVIHADDRIFELLQKRRRHQKVFSEQIYTTSPDSFTSWFSECMNTLGMPDVRFHDLRHYHASWLYRQGIPDKFAAERLGDDIQTIKKVYQHIADDFSKELNNKILAEQKAIQ